MIGVIQVPPSSVVLTDDPSIEECFKLTTGQVKSLSIHKAIRATLFASEFALQECSLFQRSQNEKSNIW